MICDYPIDSLLPHSAPMVLLDQVECVRDHGLTASLTIRPESLFCESSGVPAWVGMEYMGQTIAAYAGLLARNRGETVRIGFLVSCRRYEPTVSFFAPGAKLSVSADAVTLNDTGLRVFECGIYHGETQLVCANLNVYMPADASAFIKDGK